MRLVSWIFHKLKLRSLHVAHFSHETLPAHNRKPPPGESNETNDSIPFKCGNKLSPGLQI